MEEARQGGSPTPTGSRTPPFLVGVGEGKGEGEGRKGAPPFGAFLSFPVWPIKAQYEFP